MEIILSLLEYRKEKNDESFIKLNTVLKIKLIIVFQNIIIWEKKK